MGTASRSHVWYFAYGSNLSPEKLTGGRGIYPSRATRVRIPGWRLSLDIGGLPYQEPAFTSIAPIRPTNELKEREVIGMAYLITSSEWTSIVASEGGGIAYSVLALPAEPLADNDSAATGGPLEVLSLGTAFGRQPAARPSERYMGIILEGALHHGLPESYVNYLRNIEVYHPPENGRRKTGAALFLAIWGPLMALAEKVTNSTVSAETGRAPPATILFVRLILVVMWLTHDHIFAPIWGRGDGLESSELV